MQEERMINTKGEKLFYFRWTSGGYNSELAKTREELISKVHAETTLRIDESSIVHVTPAEAAAWDRQGYMEFY
jgi:hypothetical protein